MLFRSHKVSFSYEWPSRATVAEILLPLIAPVNHSRHRRFHPIVDRILLRFDLLNRYTVFGLDSFNSFKQFWCFKAAKRRFAALHVERWISPLPSQLKPKDLFAGLPPLQLRMLAVKSRGVLIGPRKREQPRFPV